LAARPAVPPAKGLDEACAWLRKAALTPFPPVTKLSRTTVTEEPDSDGELNWVWDPEPRESGSVNLW
jgi:hypothetical protein